MQSERAAIAQAAADLQVAAVALCHGARKGQAQAHSIHALMLPQALKGLAECGQRGFIHAGAVIAHGNAPALCVFHNAAFDNGALIAVLRLAVFDGIGQQVDDGAVQQAGVAVDTGFGLWQFKHQLHVLLLGLCPAVRNGLIGQQAQIQPFAAVGLLLCSGQVYKIVRQLER